MFDPGLRCEYHDFVHGRCTHCGMVHIRKAIAIIGKDDENVQDVGNALLRMSARRRMRYKGVSANGNHQ